MSCFPDELREDIIESFAKSKAYGQVATKDEGGVLSARTVHLHYLEAKHAFVFSTHEDSQKAKDVVQSGKIAGCYWDEKRQVQFRFKAYAELLTQNTENIPLLETMWLTMRDETRLAYVLDHHKIPYDTDSTSLPSVDQRPPKHAAVLFKPWEWDIHRFDPRGYRFGKRYIYKKKQDHGWIQEQTHLIY